MEEAVRQRKPILRKTVIQRSFVKSFLFIFLVAERSFCLLPCVKGQKSPAHGCDDGKDNSKEGNALWVPSHARFYPLHPMAEPPGGLFSFHIYWTDTEQPLQILRLPLKFLAVFEGSRYQLWMGKYCTYVCTLRARMEPRNRKYLFIYLYVRMSVYRVAPYDNKCRTSWMNQRRSNDEELISRSLIFAKEY